MPGLLNLQELIAYQKEYHDSLSEDDKKALKGLWEECVEFSKEMGYDEKSMQTLALYQLSAEKRHREAKTDEKI